MLITGIIEHRVSKHTQGVLIGLTKRSGLEILLRHAASKSACAPHVKGCRYGKHLISKTESIGKRLGNGDLDDGELIVRRDDRAAIRGKKHRAQPFEQNGMHDRIEQTGMLGNIEGTLSKDIGTQCTELVKDIPSEGIGDIVDQLRPGRIQAFGKSIKINAKRTAPLKVACS